MMQESLRVIAWGSTITNGNPSYQLQHVHMHGRTAGSVLRQKNLLTQIEYFR